MKNDHFNSIFILNLLFIFLSFPSSFHKMIIMIGNHIFLALCFPISTDSRCFINSVFEYPQFIFSSNICWVSWYNDNQNERNKSTFLPSFLFNLLLWIGLGQSHEPENCDSSSISCSSKFCSLVIFIHYFLCSFFLLAFIILLFFMILVAQRLEIDFQLGYQYTDAFVFVLCIHFTANRLSLFFHVFNCTIQLWVQSMLLNQNITISQSM